MSCDFFALAVPGVQKLHPYQPGKPLDELQREYGITNAVKLASNENPLGLSPLAKQALNDNLSELSRYPDGNGFALKTVLAKQYHVPSECITLGNGSNDVLEIIAHSFVTAAHSVVFSAHAFAVYPLVTQAIGAQAICVPAQNYGHDLQAMASAVRDDTRLLFVANPNNPTGTWNSKVDLKHLLDNVPQHVIVVVDEAYHEYVDEADYPNAMEWLQNYPNLIVSRTFSKAYGLAGLRIGYAVSNPDVANLLNRVRQPFNANSMALLAAEAVLDDKDYLEQSVQINHQGLSYLKAEMQRLELSYIPSVGNFLTVDVQRDPTTVYEALLRQGVIVRPVANYGLPTHLRVSIGLAEENQRFVEALETCL